MSQFCKTTVTILHLWKERRPKCHPPWMFSVSPAWEQKWACRGSLFSRYGSSGPSPAEEASGPPLSHYPSCFCVWPGSAQRSLELEPTGPRPCTATLTLPSRVSKMGAASLWSLWGWVEEGGPSHHPFPFPTGPRLNSSSLSQSQTFLHIDPANRCPEGPPSTMQRESTWSLNITHSPHTCGHWDGSYLQASFSISLCIF